MAPRSGVGSSGNVFHDLGFRLEEAELLISTAEVVKARGLTHSKAAKLLGATQPRESDLLPVA